MINGEWTHESYELLSSAGNGIAKEIDDVRVRLKRTSDDIIGIGQSLMKLKNAVGHGQFIPLLKIEFNMSEDTAQNFMRVARRFGNEKNRTVRFLPSKVLYELSKPSIPDEVVDATLDAIQDGTLSPSFKAVHAAVQHGISEQENTILQPQETAPNSDLEQEIAEKPMEVLRLENDQEHPQDAKRKPTSDFQRRIQNDIAYNLWKLLTHPDFDAITAIILRKYMKNLDSDTHQMIQERLTQLERLVPRMRNEK